MKLRDLFTKKIPTKNYMIIIVSSILIVLSCILFRTAYLNYREKAISKSVFQDKTIKQVNIDDLDFAINELNSSILYVSYTGNSDIYNNEKRMLKLINKMDLIDKIVYFDITELLKNNNYLNILKEKFPSVKNEITVAPLIIYIKDGEAVEAMSSELKYIDNSVLENLINKYNIGK